MNESCRIDDAPEGQLPIASPRVDADGGLEGWAAHRHGPPAGRAALGYLAFARGGRQAAAGRSAKRSRRSTRCLSPLARWVPRYGRTSSRSSERAAANFPREQPPESHAPEALQLNRSGMGAMGFCARSSSRADFAGAALRRARSIRFGGSRRGPFRCRRGSTRRT